MEERNAQVKRAVMIVRRWLDRVKVRIPQRAVFVVFVPAGGHSGKELLLDDWKLIEEAKAHRGALSGIEIHRVEMKIGEDVVDRALGIARELALPKLTVGFALGVLKPEEIRRLRAGWLESTAVRDPGPAQSFLFISQEEMEAARSQSLSRTASLSAMFLEWLRHPGSGICLVKPPVLLPRELWHDFERSLQSQAGLEQEA